MEGHIAEDGDGDLVFAGFGHLEEGTGIWLVNTEFTVFTGDIIADCFIIREFPTIIFDDNFTIKRNGFCESGSREHGEGHAEGEPWGLLWMSYLS